MTDDNLVDIKESILNKVMVFLSIKPRSVWEVDTRTDYYLRRYQSIKEAQKSIIKKYVIDYLYSLNLLDDKSFAVSFVKEKVNSKKSSSKPEVRAFLLKKKIPHEYIDLAMQKFSQTVEKEKIQQLAEKKWQTIRGDSIVTKKRKIINYLVRKGFPYDITSTVVESISDVK